MAFSFIKQLHRDSLEKEWKARPAKAAKDPMIRRRQNVVDRIDRALAQLMNGETNPSRGSYQTRDGCHGVRVQIRCGQRAMTIDGRDHWFVEDAATFFNNAREAVQRGELDGAINDALEGRGKDKGKSRSKRSPSMPLEPQKIGNPDAAPDEASVEELRAAKPGKYAQKYEKLLAAGTFSDSTSLI